MRLWSRNTRRVRSAVSARASDADTCDSAAPNPATDSCSAGRSMRTLSGALAAFWALRWVWVVSAAAIGRGRPGPLGSLSQKEAALAYAQCRQCQIARGSGGCLVRAQCELPRQIETPGAEAAGFPLLPRQHPKNLQLVSVGVLGVQAEAVAVGALASQVGT